jgi:hypothetical protein
VDEIGLEVTGPPNARSLIAELFADGRPSMSARTELRTI